MYTAEPWVRRATLYEKKKCSASPNLLTTFFAIQRLLTVGTTVDEAAFLFYSLDKACHSQLMAEAAAANGIPKIIISDEVAAYTAASVQSPVGSPVPIVFFERFADTENIHSIICTPSSNLSLSSLSKSQMVVCLSRDLYRIREYYVILCDTKTKCWHHNNHHIASE